MFCVQAFVFLGGLVIATSNVNAQYLDPCAAIGGKKWVAPADVRACFTSFKVDSQIKANIIEVVNKTLAFHTSVNYELRAPEPFTADVHEDLLGDLARISMQHYPSDYDLHIDLSRTLKRLRDGHCVWMNFCYDSLFVNFLPTPLVLLTDADGTQNVHIAPEAFSVVSAEFADGIDFWQNALPGKLKGQLSSLSGARVELINGQDPFMAVNANSLITGGFQGFGTRQNAFFSSYFVAPTGWNYSMGNFAQQSLPLSDSVKLTIKRVNSSTSDTITLPYRARFGPAAVGFTDSASYRANNCLPVATTNGVDLYADSLPSRTNTTLTRFRQQQSANPNDARKGPMNIMLDTSPSLDISLPPGLQPTSPVGSFGVAQFYMLDDKVTGVLALGLFSADDAIGLADNLLTGLQTLRSLGAMQLVVDVTNNAGGLICMAHWLHRIIVGPKSTTVPQAGLDTKARDGPLARLIVQKILAGADPLQVLLYNPAMWTNASSVPFADTTDWLQPPVNMVINGRHDAFSQRLGSECLPGHFPVTPPGVPLFEPSRVVMISNGRCASSCAFFAVTMAKEEGVTTVVVGGKKDVPQQFAGTVGGQSIDYATIDTEIKTTHLKQNDLAPPDLLVNGVQGITWRLGFGINDTKEPEEWQSRPADLNLPLTFQTVNNPVAIWKDVVARVFVSPT